MHAKFDYIVIGAGSAGCIVAAELARHELGTVLVLEAGPAAEEHPESLRSDGYQDAFVNDELMWNRRTTAQSSLGGNRIYVGTGRGLGGSGSVNGMMYLRGGAPDWDHWGLSGKAWQWSAISRDFAAMEKTLRVNKPPQNAFADACISSAEEAGFEGADDLNDGNVYGRIGYQSMNLEGPHRRSSYVAFLQNRPKGVAVETGASVSRLLIEDGRAVGVEWTRGGVVRRSIARAEVVVCAGALETPKILMTSGIGPAAHLRQHGIEVLLDAPEVGRNLQDHPNVPVFFRAKQPLTAGVATPYGFHRANPDSALEPEQADTCYVCYPARTSLREGMIRLLPSILLPEKLYRSGPASSVIRRVVEGLFAPGIVRRQVDHIWGIVVILGKPESRGTVTLASADPRDRAVVDPNYLGSKTDLDTLIRGVELARKIATGQALRELGNTELFPGPFGKSQKALEKFVRANAMTTYHFAGTCRMGKDPNAVVDLNYKVRGLTGLRIADASVIPQVPVTALNAPSMLMGYRAAQAIAAEARGQRRRSRRASA